MKMASEYMDRGMRIGHMAGILHIPGCSFCRNYSGERPMSGRGRVYSSFTLMKDGNETTTVDNSIIVDEMEYLPSREFACYGYKKTAKHLDRPGYIINRRKVRRLMAENDLLNHSYNRRKPVTRVVQSIVRVTKPDQVWEFDIRYVRVHGESRNAYLLAMVDCHSGRLLATALDTTAQETT